MSKTISFGFGKSKPAAQSATPLKSPGKKTAISGGAVRSALRDDSDNEDEAGPILESVTGFSSSGVILSHPVQAKAERVIVNPGNGDWRRRGRTNILPAEVQAQQRAEQNGDVVMVERDETSKLSGLQFAEPPSERQDVPNGHIEGTQVADAEPTKELTADEAALQALLEDGTSKPKSNAVIFQVGNEQLQSRDEAEDFRSDVASRPESSTLDEYAAMPVEEFGMAMLRGMGQKRRANGEVIRLDRDQKEDTSRKVRKQEGFLGIGAKAAPGSDVELGAWGKADMRKNNKGEGFFTPLMRENKATGERITEDELQKRVKDAKNPKGEEDWRARRDRNLENSGRHRHRERDGEKDSDRDGRKSAPKAITNGGSEDYRDQMNDFSRQSGSSKRDRDGERSSSKREQDGRDDDGARSRKNRSRSRDRGRRDDDAYREKEKVRDKYRDEEKDDSSSSRRSGHRDKQKHKERGHEDDDDRRHRHKH